MSSWSHVFLLVILVGVVSSSPRRSRHGNDEVEETKCGYESCTPTKNGVLNVHLVAHTHDDVGWLKTVDQYYYGSKASIQQAGVQFILDSVIDELLKDPARKFIYVETAFFWKWWKEQTDQMRHTVKKLVNEGRLEFIGGAWSMNDEATVHYQSVVDQFTWGLRILNDTFGECGRPRVGWQIDPFGHSREMANIFAMAGYDGMLFGRADYQDKNRRLQAKEMEMIWRGSDDTGASSDLFTGIMFNTYSPPPGFCFDIYCYDDPIIDDIHSPDYNVDDKVKSFMKFIKDQANYYKSNHIVVTMGGDFHYQDAHFTFKSLDKIIKHVNEREPTVNLLYSTPSCYLHSLHESQMKWPVKQDDFFPYASDQNSYWTGYFTSRPSIKLFERKGNNFLQVCKQLYALTNLNEKDKVDLNMLRTAMGVMQHHDAVTGTEKQHVADDYARILNEGIDDCLITTREALNKLMSTNKEKGNSKKNQTKKENKEPMNLQFDLCPLNITECNISEDEKTFIVTVYNPLGQMVSPFIRLPVTASEYIVRDPNKEVVPVQMMNLAESVDLQLKNMRNSSATSELIFRADLLPPLGFRSYYITAVDKYKTIDVTHLGSSNQPDPDSYFPTAVDNNQIPEVIDNRKTDVPKIKPNFDSSKVTIRSYATNESSEFFISNEFLNLTVDPQSGLVNSLIVTENGQQSAIALKQELLYYEGVIGNNEIAKNRSSGAYIFRPDGASAKPIGDKATIKIFKGELVEELHQKFSEWATQIVRIYKGQKHVEFEWLVGPIPIEDYIGKEIISRFTTDINNQGTFYTDSNGRQMLKRIRNKRPTWNLTLEEPVAGNYYPVTSMISMKDEITKKELYVLTDRAQGGSSMADGQLEIMVHRRLLHDDAFGVGEALNETQYGHGLIARGTHYLIFGTPQREVPIPVMARQLALQVLLQPAIFLTPSDNITLDTWLQARNEFSGLTQELPTAVHLLTLEPWKHNKILMRFEHFLQKTDDPDHLSQSTRVNLNNLFSEISIQTVRETTLAANQYIEEAKRFEWQASQDMVDDFNMFYGNETANAKHINQSESDEQSEFDYVPPNISGGKKLLWRRYIESRFPKNKNAKKYQRMGSKKSVEYLDAVVLNPMEIKTLVAEATFFD